VLPSKDGDITYKVTRLGEPAGLERRRWSASRHLRVDGVHASKPGLQEGFPRMPMAPGKGTQLKRGQEATIATLHCVDWSWAADTETYTACLTRMLRLIIDGRTILHARSVKYAEQPLSLFEIPKGYLPPSRRRAGLCRVRVLGFTRADALWP
jgi:hypothetical protein